MARPFYHAFNTMAFLVGIALVLIGFYPFYQSIISEKWPETEGVILASAVIPSPPLLGGISATYQIRIEYRFAVAGREYRRSRVEFGIGANSFVLKSFAQRLVNRYPEGKTAPVYYNPVDPLDAVLERGPSMGTSTMWIMFGIILVGISFLVRFADTLRQR